MYCLEKEERYKIAPFFDGWNETLIWSCLQGYMGNAWTDNGEHPESAQIIIGDFCFLAGTPQIDMVKNVPESFLSECLLMIPGNDDWCDLIEQQYKEKAHKFMRYATKKEPFMFDKAKLLSYTEGIPDGYSLQKIDEYLYEKIKNTKWLKELCSQFPSYRDFEKRGLGFVIVHGEKPVSGASSYTIYDKGIEIEIDTEEDYRRMGLGLAAASKLILTCLENGKYPSWDAANKESLKLSEKLGYHFDREYPAYAVTGFRSP